MDEDNKLIDLLEKRYKHINEDLDIRYRGFDRDSKIIYENVRHFRTIIIMIMITMPSTVLVLGEVNIIELDHIAPIILGSMLIGIFFLSAVEKIIPIIQRYTNILSEINSMKLNLLQIKMTLDNLASQNYLFITEEHLLFVNAVYFAGLVEYQIKLKKLFNSKFFPEDQKSIFDKEHPNTVDNIKKFLNDYCTAERQELIIDVNLTNFIFEQKDKSESL